MKQSQRESDRNFGDRLLIKDMMANIRSEKRNEGQMVRRYGSKVAAVPTQEGDEVALAAEVEELKDTDERDKELFSAMMTELHKKNQRKQMKAKVVSRNPLFKKYENENRTMAGQVSRK